jgi:phospholipid/cholesterol/gamma-HCH transport system permease protein
VSAPIPATPAPDHGVYALLERTGEGFMNLLSETLATLAFLGETLVTCGRLLLQPWKLRWTSIVAVMEEAGLDALPIIAFLSFFVGMVVAFIGATTLSDFDLEIYTVELIGYSELREFGVVLTGIVLAGRTNSSFTAQIGTMKMRQEIDAMTTLGLKPMEVIVAPRVIAMVLMTPVLAFVATLAGISGGIVVGWLSLDINPAVFIERLRNSVPIDQFWVGMSKAPVFGLVCALIACRQGLNVGGSVQSLGRATTTSVVQALFSIIAIDAMFAIFYMELGI